jgi:iron complex transport system permease protein
MKKKKLCFGIAIILLLFLSLISVKYGNMEISFLETFQILILRQGKETVKYLIVNDLRIPRIIMAVLVGGSLAVVGNVFQGIFRNPMADPFIIGTSSGAALGASIAISFFGNAYFVLKFGSVKVMAFLGALLATILAYSIAKQKNKVSVNSLLVSGIAVNFLFSSLVSFVMIYKRETIDEVVLWLMGSLYLSSWKELWINFPIVIIFIVIIYFYSKELNMILIGEEDAQSMGVDIHKVKKIVLSLSALIISIIVSLTGIIGFIGMMVPHISKYIIKTSDYRYTIPLNFLFGASLMLISDTVARSILENSEIPVGIVTSVIGSIYFMYLINLNKKRF